MSLSNTNATEPVTWQADTLPAWAGCPRRPLIEILAKALEERPDHTPLLFDDGYAITCRELQEETERFAGCLAGRVGVGDRVALAMGNRAEFVIAYLAVVANRGVVVCLPPEIGSHEAAYVRNDAGFRLAITDDVSGPVFAAMAAGPDGPPLQVLTLSGAEPRGLAAAATSDVPRLRLASVHGEIEDLLDIGYTSGTTGLPKALGGSHLEVLRYIDVNLRFRVTAAGRLLLPLQFHYGDPLVALFAAICGGSSVILMRKFSATRFWDVARALQATQILTIGSIPHMLLALPASAADREHNITSAIALGIPAGRHGELEQRFGFRWREAYGSSESGPAIAMPPHAADRFVDTGALGIPYPDIEARLVRLDGTVVEGAGSGELELRGAIVFEGYLNNPEATAEVLHDGWLRTGDLMRRDDCGVYYFESRRKEVIRRSGINIAPAEVEAVLRLHPDVADAAVVPVSDAMMGEEIKAYIELVHGAQFEPQDLADFCALKLARQKVPRYFEHRLQPFPRTPTQRIPKNELMVDGAHRTESAWDRLAAPEKNTEHG
jgi:crotonobetaine/carnitine-CoA ligase